MLYNPHREFDRGMEDAYFGNVPAQRHGQYNEGFEYARSVLQGQEDRREEQKQPEQEQPHPMTCLICNTESPNSNNPCPECGYPFFED